MSTSPPPRLRGPKNPQDAGSVLAAEYAGLRAEVISSLRSKLIAVGTSFHESDLDGFYNHAWHAVYRRMLDGGEIYNRPGLLVQIAYRAALDELRTISKAPQSAVLEGDVQADPVDVDAQIDSRNEVAQLVAGMHVGLSNTELQAAVLCYVHERTRPEAAQLMGVSPRRMQKLMDAVSPKMTAIMGEIRSGSWCESNRGIISSYALGALEQGDPYFDAAHGHVQGCASCRRRVLGMRGVAASVVPAPLLLLSGAAILGTGAVAAGVAAAAHTGASAAGGLATAGGSSAAAGAAAVSGGGASGGAGSGVAHGGGLLGKLAAASSQSFTVVAGSAAVTAVAVGAAAMAMSGGDSKPPQSTTALPVATSTTSVSTAAEPVPKPETKPKPKKKPKKKAPKKKAQAPAPVPVTTTAPPVATQTTVAPPRTPAPTTMTAPRTTTSPEPADGSDSDEFDLQ